MALGLSSDTTVEELESYFSKYGVIEDISWNISPKHHSKPYAFITFESLKQVPKSEHFIHGEKVILQKLNGLNESFETKSIRVNGLLTSLKEEQMAEYFSRFGEVVEVTKQQKGSAIRVAFVTFEDSSSVEKAMKTVLHLIDGKIVDIRKASPLK